MQMTNKHSNEYGDTECTVTMTCPIWIGAPRRNENGDAEVTLYGAAGMRLFGKALTADEKNPAPAATGNGMQEKK